jgi:hypothetical protein
MEEDVYLEFKAALGRKYEFTENRTLHEFIGMKINFERGRFLFITQKYIVHSITQKTKVGTATSRTPATSGFVYTKTDCPATEEDRAMLLAQGKDPHTYRMIVATINYAACWTRGDVTFAVNKLANFMRDPGAKHGQELYKLLAYLNRTKEWGLLFGRRDGELNTGPARIHRCVPQRLPRYKQKHHGLLPQVFQRRHGMEQQTHHDRCDVR